MSTSLWIVVTTAEKKNPLASKRWNMMQILRNQVWWCFRNESIPCRISPSFRAWIALATLLAIFITKASCQAWRQTYQTARLACSCTCQRKTTVPHGKKRRLLQMKSSLTNITHLNPNLTGLKRKRRQRKRKKKSNLPKKIKKITKKNWLSNRGLWACQYKWPKLILRRRLRLKINVLRISSLTSS